MNSRERVIRTLEFNNPDKIPIDLWILPAARSKYGKVLEDILDIYERDIISIDGPLDLSYIPKTYEKGNYTDTWGTNWTNLQGGMVGEVKNPIFEEIEKISKYNPPNEVFIDEWKEYKPKLNDKIRNARMKNKFVVGGWVNIFERMQFLRGTENLYCDMAERSDDFFQILDIVFSFYREYVKAWLETDVDAIVFGDDWGSQRSLLISPSMWISIFRPVYKELFDMIKAKGKYIFFHSDGYIMDLYTEFIELGVNAINSQLWCMGVENVAEKFAGKITFWGEISRQDILPNGTPTDIKAAAEKMKKYLFLGGGLIGQSEVGKDVPPENIRAVLAAWD
ncbi:MAG TPA: uroporphyrinogen decarboxylase family protein [Ruminiclostridium sp.]